jgi:hypothetical protein
MLWYKKQIEQCGDGEEIIGDIFDLTEVQLQNMFQTKHH